jgi:zinc transporter ZupT
MFSASYGKSKVLLYVILVELVTVTGAVTGLFFLKQNISRVITGIVMAHIAGGFIFLGIHAVLGEMLKNHKNLVIISFGSGLAVIFLVHLIT